LRTIRILNLEILLRLLVALLNIKKYKQKEVGLLPSLFVIRLKDLASPKSTYGYFAKIAGASFEPLSTAGFHIEPEAPVLSLSANCKTAL